MSLSNLAQNMINGIAVVSMIALVLKGRVFDALMVMLVGLLCAPLSVIGGQSIPFAYLACAGLVVCVLFRARHLKLPRTGSLLMFTTLLWALYVLKWSSTLVCECGQVFSDLKWVVALGQFRNIIIYSVSAMLTYNELRNHNNKVRTEKLLSSMVAAFGIAMVLNLGAACIQLVYSELGFSIVKEWYSSESRTTIQSMERMGTFLRLYGLNYSPVMLGFKSLLSFGGTLFYTLMPHDATENRKATLVAALSFINGVLSFSKTFIFGFLICVIVYCIYSVMDKSQDLSRVGMRSMHVMLGCFIIIFVVVAVNANKLQIATGLPFNYYFSKIVHAPRDAFASRYRYELVPPDTQLTYDVIQEHPVLGVGLTSVFGEFGGDSEYLGAMHDGGIVALILTLIELWLILRISRRRRLHMFVGLFLTSGMAGFAMPTLSTDVCMCLLGVCVGCVSCSESDLIDNT